MDVFYVLLMFLFPLLNSGNQALAAAQLCEKINMTITDTDGLPFCPDVVRKTTAFAVTRCAYNQAREWHPATRVEKNLMMGLVQDLKDAKPADAMAKAEKLKLQTCRSKEGADSFLLMYTRPGVKDYSGPFLMYREGGQTSQVVIHSPHDGQDGTHSSTKAAFADSNALAMISNGHPRRLSGEKKGPYKSDWAHTSADLGYTAFLAFKQKFPESIHLHIHGLAANRVMITDSVGWKSEHRLRTAFHAATKKAIGDNKRFDVVNWRFNGWMSGIAMTMNENGKGRKDNERWVGAEVAVAIHKNTQILTKMVRNLEQDYLGKPRPVVADLDKAVEEVAGDDVDLSEEPVPAEADLEVLEEEPGSLVRPPNPSPESNVTTAPTGYSYAPVPKGNVGTKKLACVGISYTNPINDYVTAARCLKTARQVADFYNRNSGGKLKLIPSGHHMKYDGEAWKSFKQASKLAKATFKGANYYIIPNIFRKGGNHASGGIAWMSQLTKWVVNHEVGHLLGLPHSGRYIYPDGKPEYQPYGDDDSPMGNNGYKYLTAPQYYGMGWLEKDQVLLATGNEGVPITLTQIDDHNKGGVVGVLIRRPDARDAFISYPHSCKGCVALHLTEFGTRMSGLVRKGPEIYDPNFTGLHVKVLKSIGQDKVEILIDYNKQPPED